MKQKISVIALLSLLLGLVMQTMVACAPVSQETSELWVVTEESTSDGMNYQAEEAAKIFQQEYPGVTVKLEILPTDATERSIYLKQLRTQIMAGNGPDVYLLPTGNELITDSRMKQNTDSVTVEPLFSDIEQAMYAGMFWDLQDYYEADTALNTEGLQQDVMDAGVVDGARYVLPLRYTMPVLLVNRDSEITRTLDAAGLSWDDGISDLAAYALDVEDTMLATGLQLPEETSVFSMLYDYQKGKNLITKDEISEYMRLYQQWYALSNAAKQQMIETVQEETVEFLNEEFHDYFSDVLEEFGLRFSIGSFNSVSQYVISDIYWIQSGLPVYSTSLSDVIESAVLAEALQQQIDMYPLRRNDGSVGAEITYFGAISASCTDAALAYDYLRLFLTEDFQWDGIRPRADRSRDDANYKASEVQSYGFVEDSWPVRAIGASSHLYSTLQYQSTYITSGISETKARLGQVKSTMANLTDVDLPILNIDIDEARFPIYLAEEETLAYALSQLNNADGTPTDVDIDVLAEKVYQNLWWHLAEG